MNAFQRLDDKLLLSPKIIYVVICMVFYCVHLFRPRFMKVYLRIEDDMYGYISALMALVSFTCMTLWGTLADALGRHRFVLGFLCFALAASFGLTYFVVMIPSATTRLVMSSLVLCLYSFFASGIIPLTDHITLRLLSNRPGFSKDMYSRQRLWGTISYAGTSKVVGWFEKRYTVASVLYILPIFSTIAVFTVFTLAPADTPKPFREILSFLRRKRPSDPIKEMSAVPSAVPADQYEKSPSQSVVEAPPSPSSSSSRSPIWQLLSNGNYLFMLVVVFMAGSARAVMTLFASKYWQEKMNLDGDQASTAGLYGVVLEVVIFFLGPSLLRIFGIYWLLIFGQLAMVARCWAYVQIPAEKKYYWLVYMVELLKGVAFGFTQTSGVKLASDVAPQGLEATAQALYTSVYSQLPAVLTAVGGGHLYGQPRALFFITAVVSTMALGLFVIKYWLDGSIRLVGGRRKSQQLTPAGAP